MTDIKSFLKRLAASKFLRYLLSGTLIYFAFRRIDLGSLAGELSRVPMWFAVTMVVYSLLIVLMASYRWSLLLFKNPNWDIVWNFVKASFVGSFYNLVFPTGVAGDLLKWVPLQKKYPQLTKSKLLGSSLLDRVIGFTAFTIVAFAATLVGKLTGFDLPNYLVFLFSGLFVGVMIFYFVVFNFEAERWLDKYPKLKKIDQVIELIKSENKGQLIKALGVAFLTEFAWITPVYWVSLAMNAGFSLLAVYIFIPIVSLILVLPVSIAGFGAREQLYLIFFSQLGVSDVKILAVSTFVGGLGVINSLIGGLFLLL